MNNGHENQSSSSTETELNNNFDRKWADIDKRINLAIRQKYNELKQYSMRKNLLAHKVENIPTDIHGYEFNKWCVNLINDNFVDTEGHSVLRRPLVPDDIDRAHILKTRREDSKIVLIQFMNMTLRNEVFFAKKVLKNKSMSISEHLTPDNIQLLNLAKENGGNAWSSDTKIWVEKSGGGKRRIHTPADLGNKVASKQSGNVPWRKHGNARYDTDNSLSGYYYSPPPINNSDVMYPADPKNPAFINFQDAKNRGYVYDYGYNNNGYNYYGNNNNYAPRGRGKKRGRGRY